MTHPRSKYLYDICPKCKGKKSKKARTCSKCFTSSGKNKLSWKSKPTLTDKWRCLDCNSFIMPQSWIKIWHKGHKIEALSSLPQPNSREKTLMKALGIKSVLSLYIRPKGATIRKDDIMVSNSIPDRRCILNDKPTIIKRPEQSERMKNGTWAGYTKYRTGKRRKK